MKISHGLPHFDWENVDDLYELGVGNFGSVHSAKSVHDKETTGRIERAQTPLHKKIAMNYHR